MLHHSDAGNINIRNACFPVTASLIFANIDISSEARLSAVTFEQYQRADQTLFFAGIANAADSNWQSVAANTHRFNNLFATLFSSESVFRR